MAKQIKNRVEFSFNAPEAQSVLLAADFTSWQEQPQPLNKLKSGLWKVSVSLAPGTYQYRFLVDGQWADDPACMVREPNTFGGENCVKQVV